MSTNKKEKDEEFPGYTQYPESEDIYSKGKKENYSLDDEDYNLEEGLDVPGSEFDDDAEPIGQEDEENNYYSLGGDNHEDLEETNPDLEN